ncbi:hypothetical protein BDN72DRAFT_108486 [Pluteus cervinus]|uniref:Uncharacterized protein n=1 Tax=Pluteus cervinus TaxID=181527 RepID=A0ACD3AP92_9AGAR|nr:hypothetical protein BDN72DRAFT_108486 [Pluteus cervinus]
MQACETNTNPLLVVYYYLVPVRIVMYRLAPESIDFTLSRDYHEFLDTCASIDTEPEPGSGIAHVSPTNSIRIAAAEAATAGMAHLKLWTQLKFNPKSTSDLIFPIIVCSKSPPIARTELARPFGCSTSSIIQALASSSFTNIRGDLLAPFPVTCHVKVVESD